VRVYNDCTLSKHDIKGLYGRGFYLFCGVGVDCLRISVDKV